MTYHPGKTYKPQWRGLGNWLRTGVVATHNRIYREFRDARNFVHGLGLKNRDEWQKYCKSGKKPEDIVPMERLFDGR